MSLLASDRRPDELPGRCSRELTGRCPFELPDRCSGELPGRCSGVPTIRLPLCWDRASADIALPRSSQDQAHAVRAHVAGCESPEPAVPPARSACRERVLGLEPLLSP